MRSIDRDISEYFIGSIVIVNSKAGEYLLLDGQQRMATSAILLSVIRDFLKRHNSSAAEDLHRKYLSDFDYDTERTTYKISLNHYDREFFRRLILTPKTDDYKEPAPEHASHHLILRARDYFASKFEEVWSAGDNKKSYNWSLNVQKKLLRDFTLISVVSVDEDAAAEVFETLGPVDEVDSQPARSVIQDWLLGGGLGSRFDDGRGVGVLCAFRGGDRRQAGPPAF